MCANHGAWCGEPRCDTLHRAATARVAGFARTPAHTGRSAPRTAVGTRRHARVHVAHCTHRAVAVSTVEWPCMRAHQYLSPSEIGRAHV